MTWCRLWLFQAFYSSLLELADVMDVPPRADAYVTFFHWLFGQITVRGRLALSGPRFGSLTANANLL